MTVQFNECDSESYVCDAAMILSVTMILTMRRTLGRCDWVKVLNMVRKVTKTVF